MALIADANHRVRVELHVALGESRPASRVRHGAALRDARALDARPEAAIAAHEADRSITALADRDPEVVLERRVIGRRFRAVHARPERQHHEQDSHGCTVSPDGAPRQVPLIVAPEGE